MEEENSSRKMEKKMLQLEISSDQTRYRFLPRSSLTVVWVLVIGLQPLFNVKV